MTTPRFKRGYSRAVCGALAPRSPSDLSSFQGGVFPAQRGPQRASIVPSLASLHSPFRDLCDFRNIQTRILDSFPSSLHLEDTWRWEFSEVLTVTAAALGGHYTAALRHLALQREYAAKTYRESVTPPRVGYASMPLTLLCISQAGGAQQVNFKFSIQVLQA